MTVITENEEIELKPENMFSRRLRDTDANRHVLKSWLKHFHSKGILSVIYKHDNGELALYRNGLEN